MHIHDEETAKVEVLESIVHDHRLSETKYLRKEVVSGKQVKGDDVRDLVVKE